MGMELDEVWSLEQPGGVGRRRVVGPYPHGSDRPEVPAGDVECSSGSGWRACGGVIVALLMRESVAIDPGRTLKGEVQGPDGKPLSGANLNGIPLATASFALHHVNPRRTQRLEFHHRGKRLGLYKVFQGDEKEPLVIQLQPYGSVIGRIVDRDGTPVQNLPMRIFDSVG